MTNVEYIYLFANKHNFPKTECEVIFNIADDGRDIIKATDNDIISVKFDKNLIENEIKIEDIRFDVDSDFPDDVFFMWQNDNPEMSFKGWISLGRYVPTYIQNADFFNELDALTKDIEIKLGKIFLNLEKDDGDSDFNDEDENEKDDED